MTLQVPFEDFASAAERFQIKDAYVLTENELLVISACNPSLGVTLLSHTAKDPLEARRIFESKDIAVHKGIWSDRRVEFENEEGTLFVAAVSYQSGHPIPGLWIDAYAHEPNHVEVLEAIYAEFRHTGELPDISIEEFIRGANPNVVVIPESRLMAFIEAKKAHSIGDR